MITLTSCQTRETETKTITKITTQGIGTSGFLIKKVVKGDNIWGYSNEVYGTGTEWRTIVNENPFLGEPGRVYYDKERSQWIVLIYPGEVVKIKGRAINPTFVSEETTITTTSETVGIPWWAWLLITVGSIVFLFFLCGMVGLFSYHRHNHSCCHCSGSCHEVNCLLRQLDQNRPSVSYRTQADGGFSLSSLGASETTFTRDANGRTSFTVRR